MKRNLIETLMGAVVLVIAAFFVITTYQSSGLKKDYGYKLNALFDKVDGIAVGSDVRVGGIKVGTVVGESLDMDSYRAKLIMGIDKDVRVPTDSTAEIVSDGLLGGKYISLVPGADNEMLKDGGVIQYTQSSVNLEQLIGKIAFGGASSDSAKPAAASTPKPQAATPPVQTETIISTAKPGSVTPVGAASPIVTPKANVDLKKAHSSGTGTE